MNHHDGCGRRLPGNRPWPFAHPFMASYTEALASNGLAITYTLDETITHDSMRVFACNVESALALSTRDSSINVVLCSGLMSRSPTIVSVIVLLVVFPCCPRAGEASAADAMNQTASSARPVRTVQQQQFLLKIRYQHYLKSACLCCAAVRVLPSLVLPRCQNPVDMTGTDVHGWFLAQRCCWSSPSLFTPP